MRPLDLPISFFALVIVSPILLVAMLAIRLESRGNPIFAQARVGRNRRTFTCYKLRTMEEGTRQGASHEVGSASVTAVGRFLRRTKIDELPQLWNVLKGEMSLVGPRPCLPSQTALIAARDGYGLYEFRPGLTGPGQVAGIDMSDPERLAAIDATWTADAGFRSYSRYLLLTMLGHGRGDAAGAGGKAE